MNGSVTRHCAFRCAIRLAICGSAAIVLLASAALAAPPTVKFFPLSDVRLLDGPFKQAQDADRTYMLKYDIDRLLAPFRKEAGLEPKAEPYADWERIGMAGHAGGHYLSAAAQLYASTGDPEIKKRLDYMVAELAECQRALGDGYVGGIPNSVAAWDRMAAGTLQVSTGFRINGLWVPWYNLHKTFAGLRDAWLVAGNAQARDVLIRLTDWCDGLTSNLFDEQMQQMLDVEHGGMNEVLADVSEIAGDKKYLALAKRFSHRKILEPLLAKQDALDGLHANTTVPKVVGYARIGELAGDQTWIDAGRFFWGDVVNRRSAALGGHGVKGLFQPVKDFSTMMTSHEGLETCGTHNMLRLSEQLYRLDADVKYAEYYERALFNNILSSQHPDTGDFVWYTPLRPRGNRVYSQAEVNFWCCVGTGMQSHSKHGRFIYAQADDGLYVNLFIASELTWPERKLKLRQETKFPDEPRTRLVVSLEAPSKWTMHVRCPGWVRKGECKIKVNGEPWPGEAAPASYVAIDRQWRDGDRVDVELPMHTALVRLPDGTDYVAVVHGPIVLGAKVDDPDLARQVEERNPLNHVSAVRMLPIEEGPKFVGSEAAVIAGIEPVADQPLTFTARRVIRPDAFSSLTLVPFFRVHDTRYMVYWPIDKQ
ncbi:MAG: beta-L-arabinofuranosidase domain-containing protein [Pirellulales bacterium]